MKQFTTAIGRLIGGSIYKLNEKKPEPGEEAKTPMYDIGIAIPKSPGQTHWNQKPATWDTDYPKLAGMYWGEQIWAAGVEDFGAAVVAHPSFAWKITDGDSTVSTKPGKPSPSQKEGYPGCWVLWLSGSYAPPLYDATGQKQIVVDNYLKTGSYIQVCGNAKGNGNLPGNAKNRVSGVYLNHELVAFNSFGPEIVKRADPAAAGFGGAAPAGASTVPLGGMGQIAAPLPPAPGALPAAPGAAVQYAMTPKAGAYTREQMNASGWKDDDLVAQGYMTVAAPAPAPLPPPPQTATAVMPNPAMIPAAPPVAPVGPKFIMTPLAQGHTREQMNAAGWSDQDLQTNGYMVVG